MTALSRLRSDLAASDDAHAILAAECEITGPQAVTVLAADLRELLDGHEGARTIWLDCFDYVFHSPVDPDLTMYREVKQ